MPSVMVSASDYLSQGFNFIVTLNTFTFGFKEVQGLSVTRYTDLITEGGVNDHSLLVGRPNNENNIYDLTFSRGLLKRSTSLVTGAAKVAAALIPNNILRKAALLGITALDPQESLEVGPALGTIEVYNRYKKLTASYTFLSLGMTEWSVSDLSADSNDIIIETIKIAHTGLTRVPIEAPSVVGAIKGLISSFKDDSSSSSSSSVKSNFEEKYKEYKERYQKAEKLKAQKDEELKLWREQRKKEQELKELEKAQEEQKRLLLEEQRKQEAEQRAKDIKKRQEEAAKRREEAEKAKSKKLSDEHDTNEDETETINENSDHNSNNSIDENSDDNLENDVDENLEK
ncbi:MAG: phage tail protein [Clostridia bacterium]|nr:phage tail protein [Clostridia bacterium]